MTRQVLTAAFLWSPVIALWVLNGFAFGWWLPTVLAAGTAILVFWAVIYRRRLRRVPPDLDARRAHEEGVYRRSVRWTKIWGLSLTGMMIFLVVLALVILIVDRA